MESLPDALFIAVKALSAVVAGVLAYLSYMAYRRTGSVSIGTFAAGLGCFALGALVAVGGGVSVGIETTVLLADGTLVLIGLCVIVYSAYRT